MNTQAPGTTALWYCRHAALVATLLWNAAMSTAHAAVRLAFTPDPALEQDAGALSPEGCIQEPGVARGTLTGSSQASACHSAHWGGDVGNATESGGSGVERADASSARFATSPLGSPMDLHGTATLVAYYFAAYERPGAPALPIVAWLEYQIEDVAPVTPLEQATVIARGRAFLLNGQAGGVHRGVGLIAMPGYRVPAGHVLRISLSSEGAPDGRLLFGGAPLASTPAFGARDSYHDAGITFNADEDDDNSSFAGVVGGAAGAGLLLPLLLTWLSRLGDPALARRRTRTTGVTTTASDYPRVRANSFM